MIRKTERAGPGRRQPRREHSTNTAPALARRSETLRAARHHVRPGSAVIDAPSAGDWSPADGGEGAAPPEERGRGWSARGGGWPSPPVPPHGGLAAGARPPPRSPAYPAVPLRQGSSVFPGRDGPAGGEVAGDPTAAGGEVRAASSSSPSCCRLVTAAGPLGRGGRAATVPPPALAWGTGARRWWCRRREGPLFLPPRAEREGGLSERDGCLSPLSS